MSQYLVRASDSLERARSIDQLWERFERAISAEGFRFYTFLSADPGGQLYQYGNLPLHLGSAEDEEPFLDWCCSTYHVSLTGTEFLHRHSFMPGEVRQIMREAGALGFRAGLGVPVRLTGSGRCAAFNLGTSLDGGAFEMQMLPKADALRAFCLIAHRRVENFLNASARDRVLHGIESLSRRERVVLDLMAEGLSRAQVAERAGVSVHTVSSHIKSIYKKLGVHSQAEAVRVALTQNAPFLRTGS
ncbi:LuxR C-terminal-related transcriptional regulator [Rhodovulum sp. YNF3179]|uniref:helix-turn-helix transcriptional regulator n=1 Tax=Rhodovulum sp. YNF3179 TaxID=3425127 RepID=UPI003D33EA42